MSAPLWTPPADWRASTRIGHFVQYAELRTGRTFTSYDELWRWSVTSPDEFWGSIWDHFGVDSEYDKVLADDNMPGANWFPGARLNFARHLLDFRQVGAADTAVIGVSQTRDQVSLTFAELTEQVGRAREALQRLGVRRGDRVVAYLPNIPETLIAFLATASLGAVWASCAPEFGSRSVLDRFRQLEPTVLLAVSGYTYGTKPVDRSTEVAAIRDGLPSLTSVIEVEYGAARLTDAVSWGDLLAESTGAGPEFDSLPFDHPLFVLFSSGTTGQPKAIVHSHGGVLLEHLKNHALSWDLGPGDRLLWFTTTAWMMWNALISALLVDSSIVMIDGNPLHPGLEFQWRLAEETGATFMGASPGFLMATRRSGLRPAEEFDLSRVRQIGAAGSPLPAEGYHWVREVFGPEVLLNVGSGGTDVCSGIVQGSPLQPVVAGEISGPCLGFDAQAWDDEGRPVVGELGELVITRPVPSMPIGFWGDSTGERYRTTYFDRWPGVWRHGDWIRFSESGSCVIAGRSDATLNRGGVRLGTAEFYQVLEELPEVEDSLVVHLEDPQGGNGELVLFVVLAQGNSLDEDLERRLAGELKQALSPRHVPDLVVAVPAVPRNRTGKKLELPVKRILQGRPASEVAAIDSLADPHSLDAFAQFARGRT
ncbi:acetoacetyl-CoA synthetase [Kribbella sp. VKM Ac-2527]|uniref:Acetoacetyl-CoA synthetase n=1 Tax=Kribbella caucasensis TaxID=2512215 RepID=A0A4R6KH41_9ACTN|nr:acetoacetate--CoA ligase [Kribbella sp. VKM Ac-2527]TDO48434.1 acetoacetyl-CoA synthetase [Kribbella sp. VKM Ac-2527]